MTSISKPNEVSIVILPLPAQGHLNQLLHLALLLSSRTIPVHYVSSSVHNRQARDRSTSSFPNLLHFHDFHLPPFDSPPPDPSSPSNFPSHLQPCFTASLHLLLPLRSLLLSLSCQSSRVVLIHDSAMSFSTKAASTIPNAESYAFHSVSAYAILSFIERVGFEDCFTPEFLDFILSQHRMIVKDHGRLINTCRSLETASLSKLAAHPSWKDQKAFCVGPLNPIKRSTADRPRHECLAWLDAQPRSSVLYVSFGTTTTLSERQVLELGEGIRASGQRFLWVLREADRGDIYAAADDDREQCRDAEVSCCGEGMVYRGWAPQLEILGHSGVRGFLSHCGWNSCMESLSMGVPMLTWPMHSDQPSNARLITDMLKVGVSLREWGRRDEVLGGEEIRDGIMRLMGDGEEGREVGERCREVGGKIRDCRVDNRELDSFVAYITR